MANDKNEIQEILKSVNSNISNLELDQLKEDLKIIKFKLQEINDTLEGRILANNIHNKAIEERHIKDGEITADKITLTLDDINNGTNYGRVLSTSISAGKIILSEVNGVIDDIADGTYAKVLSTSLSNGAVLLAKASGTLDDITNGTNYGKVKITNISAGNILLAQCIGNLDNIADGINYGKVALTSISAGKIIVAGLDSGITDRMFADLATKNNIQAWRHTTDVTLIDGGKIYTGSIVAGSIAANAIETSKIQAGAITADKIATSTITANKLKIGAQSFTHNLVFSSTDLDTVSWAAGTITMADGTTYSIVAGNTGNMTARTYIYLDIAISTTILQKTTTAGTAVGDGKLLIATAINSTTQALFEVHTGIGGTVITGSKIETGTITADKLSVTSLSAISATLGTVSAGTISGTRLKIGSGTNEDIYFEDSGIAKIDYLLMRKEIVPKLKKYLSI